VWPDKGAGLVSDDEQLSQTSSGRPQGLSSIRAKAPWVRRVRALNKQSQGRILARRRSISSFAAR
jgi:hypothetical protein